MKRALARVLLATALATSGAAQANSSTLPDYSDLWWNASESGWGAHVTLQDDVIFLVLFVYDAQRQPRFFVASEMRRAQGAGPFTGELYSTTGPAFAGAFNPAGVAVRTVGGASLSFATPGAATLTYSVDGVTVNKSITRQSWRIPDLNGEYKGGLFASTVNCPSGLPSLGYPGSVKISRSGDLVTIDSTFSPGFAEAGTCRMVGRLSQLGTVVSITEGTYGCEFFNEPNSVSGTFTLTAIEANESGFGGRYTANQGGQCTHTGYLGGMRRGYDILPPVEEPPAE